MERNDIPCPSSESETDECFSRLFEEMGGGISSLIEMEGAAGSEMFLS